VVKAIAKHDPDGAEEAMRAHLVSALERLETFVDGGNATAEARQIAKQGGAVGAAQGGLG